MSTFADYSEISRAYDRTRGAEAFEIWLGALAGHAPAPLRDLRLLDAGCGTGNYAEALWPHVALLNGVDPNADMLERATAKLGDAIAQDRVGLEPGSLLALPFEDGTFHAVMINQVLHHLEDGDNRAYNGHRAAISEAARVLRPGGLLLVNACSHRQLTDGFWYTHLIAQGLEACRRRIAPTALFRQILNEAGFDVIARHVPAEAVMQGESYFRLDGVLDPEWRAGDSIWAMSPEDEIRHACETVRTLLESGEGDDWLAERDGRRGHVGQFTFWIARRAG